MTDLSAAPVATVYTQAGAVHGGMLARFQQLEAEARRDRRGMWVQQTEQYESPAEYKKRHSRLNK